MVDVPMSEEASPRIVLITHPLDGAGAFARLLVERRIAACVNRIPATSTYRWQGSIEEDEEVLLIAKITARRWAELEEALAEHHPHDVPECVCLEPERVAASYLAWMQDETSV